MLELEELLVRAAVLELDEEEGELLELDDGLL